jgi:hypothetical protein
MMKKQICVTLLLGLIAHSAPGRAEDQTVLATARELAVQGFKDYDAGRYVEADQKLSQAYQVVRLPTLAVQRARTLVKLGRLVAAAELYLQATNLERAASWQSIQDEAVSNAERERSELLPKIPRLKIVIEGADAAQVAVSIDNAPVPAALLGAEHMVDPGQRTVVGNRGSDEAHEVVSLKEGEVVPVTLRFAAAAPIPTPAVPIAPQVSPTAPAAQNPQTAPSQQPGPAIASTPAPAASPAPVTRERSRSVSAATVLGLVGVGLGAGGLVFGAVEGAAAKSKRDSLIASGQCPDGQHCDERLASDVDNYRMKRNLCAIGLVAGGIVTTIGVTLLVVPAKRVEEPRVALRLAPGYVGLYGTIR